MHNLTNTTRSEPGCPKVSDAHGHPVIGGDDRFPSALTGIADQRTECIRNDSIALSLFLKAFVGLLAFDLFGFGHRFAGMRRFVSNWKVSTTEADRNALTDVCTAVNYACAWYPKRALCLQRSAVTTCLLRSCGVPATMVMGAQPLPFKAHAWTEVNGAAVNEHRDVRKYYTVWEQC